MMRILSVWLLCWFVITVAAQEDMKARVEQLELQVRNLTDEVVRLRHALHTQQQLTEELSDRPGPERIYDDVIESFRKERGEDDFATAFYRQLIHSHIWLGGYIEVKIEETESTEDPDLFDLSSLALTFRSSLTDYLSIHGEISLSEENDAEVHHGYLLVSLDPLVNFKGGVIRVPWGKYNGMYSPPSQKLGSVPLVDRYIVPSVWGDPGVSLFGQFTAMGFTVSYEALMSNGLGEDGFSPEDGNVEARQGIRRDGNHEPQWSGRLEFVPRLNVEVFSCYFGLSGIIGQYDRSDEFRGWAIDGFVQIGPFNLIGDHDRMSVTGEYAGITAERGPERLLEYPDTVGKMGGYYVEFHYRFFPESWRDTFFLFGDESAFGLSFRHERMDMDTPEITRLKSPRIYTVGFDFYPISQTVVRVEYSWIREHVGSWEWNNRVQASFATHF